MIDHVPPLICSFFAKITKYTFERMKLKHQNFNLIIIEQLFCDINLGGFNLIKLLVTNAVILATKKQKSSVQF